MAFSKSSRFKLSFVTNLILLSLISIGSVFCVETVTGCLSGPCQNNATCEDVTPEYICHCPSVPIAFVNKFCEKSSELCSPNSCQKNVTCIKIEHPSDLICHCPPGFSGELCEAYVHQCANSLCEGGASCQAGAFQVEAADYRCVCPEGYMGTHCEADVNECASSPCQNRALCRDGINDYSCYCVPGFQGKHCDIEVNECVSQPCQNGATCLNKIGKYVCACMPGYTGRNCELEIDECQSEQCFNGATCQDYLNGFICTCVPGFLGDFCEINVEKCRSQPCQNGGQCIDGINGYSCICSGTGFTGLHCEILIPPCLSQPCLNNATCEERGENYTCQCWPGFTGNDCEMDVSECSSNPCLSGSECIELSWKERYGTAPELPAEFDYQYAAGYVCKCQQGFTGVLCQEDIDECDTNPCYNAGTCENINGSYICHCPPTHRGGIAYGGPNCTDVLIGCESHNCQNGGTCTPSLKNGLHEFSCMCLNGYSGSMCQTSTTFSFEVKGYLHVETSLKEEDISSNVTLSFRTVLPNAIIFHRGNKDVFIKLELLHGLLHLTLQITKEQSFVLELPHNVTDGEWHTVETTLGKNTFEMKVLDRSCSNDCAKQEPVGALDGQLVSALQNTFIGGLKVDGSSSESINGIHTELYLIGCLQDIHINSELILPGKWSSESALNVNLGCSKRDRCVTNPCQNRGRCVNLWQSYQCECYRPYEGQNCSDEYVVARFGNDNTEGYAAFKIDDNPGENITISMFVRTRRLAGLLLVLKNSTCQYLTIWLEEGRVKVQISQYHTLSVDCFMSDGHFHLLSVKIEQDKMELFQSAQKLSYISIHAIKVQSEDIVYVGGLSDEYEVAAFGGYFKGCIQDLRINTKRLQFYPIGAPVNSYSKRTLVNVTRGCTGDNTCKIKPCLNGGVCYSIWDDFTCSCPPSTAGRMCEDVRWCELNPCPSAAMCQPLNKGFECITNATFTEDSNIMYRGNGKIDRDLTNITFSFRTRKQETTLLHAEKGPEFVTVAIQNSHILFELQSGMSFITVSMKSLLPVSDGRWHKMTLSMIYPTSLFSRWHMMIDGAEETATTSVATGNLNFLKEGTVILLGGLGPDVGGNLVGCLSTVEISGVSLPYFDDADIHIAKPQQGQFIKTSTKPAITGCSGASVCTPNPCLTGGSCEDLFNLFNCTCPAGWAGLKCDINIDECASNPCIHGNCADKTLSYECDCDPGYTGKSCELEIDECEKHRCVNGATCLDGINSYSCLCSPNFTGPFCDQGLRPDSFLWHYPRLRYPKLPVSICGNGKRNYTCFNGGNCTRTRGRRMCTCLPGFTGDRCEMDIDECKSNPCLNGGLCRNMFNKYQCLCDMNFAGDHCELDVSDISFYVSLLVWQNLFQLLSYLTLRLEDDPEVEWGED
ncbi:protein crumbs homolog 1-like isoform X2 [Acipenser ruthenus]|uniref:protein crumbs homolog 1-like isoform X2 n=1 Tax=Acipenser ruthenus TaxID=7906 RepID=UPI00274232B6|nr:protein crumbs homolog 1-like isoform X2 [Acipenser ruthenus]